MTATATLILLRHGQSLWNATNQFTGWVDVSLTDQGVAEARRAGELLDEAQLKPDIVFTSVLRRAIITANIALDAADRLWIPVTRDWRLNERHYGKLQGLDKAQIKQEFGEKQFMTWRRSYDTPPPAIDPDNTYSQTHDPRYFSLQHVPLTECLKDVVERIVPYTEDVITPHLAAGKIVLVVAHGNSLRAMVKYLNGISDTDIAELNIPTGIPLVYNLIIEGDRIVTPHKGEYYLDPEAAKLGAAAVAQQGSNN